MRILFITPYYYPDLHFGGPPQKIRFIAIGLTRRGHDVEIATFDSKNATNGERELVDGVPVQYLRWVGKGLRQLPLDRRSLSSAISDTHLIHCYGLYNFLCPLAVQFAHRYHKPTVLEPLGMYPPRARNRLVKGFYNFAITRRMIRQSQVVIATSRAELKDLKKIVPSNKLIY